MPKKSKLIFLWASLAQLAIAMPAAAGPAESSAKASPTPELRFVFEERVDVGPAISAGAGPRGTGNMIPLLGGTITGPRLNGSIMSGGADWQLVRHDGCTEIVADYFIKANDGALINIRNVGLACEPNEKRGLYLQATPTFTAPIGPHDWLNKSVFTSQITPVFDDKGLLVQVVLRFFEIL